MSILLFAFLIGVVSGLRAMVAPAAVSWAARAGVLKLTGALAFLGYLWTPFLFTAFALGELINDKLPKTPSRTVPPQFIGRVLSGVLVGAALGNTAQLTLLGLLAGVLGAVAGTLGGAWLRAAMGKIFGRDLPAALTEDAVAILLGLLTVTRA